MTEDSKSNKILNTLFSTPREKTKDEIEKEKDEWQKLNNPFIWKKNNRLKEYGISEVLDPVSLDGTCAGYNGAARIIIDDMGGSIEKYYFWYLNGWFGKHEKTTFGTPAKKIYKLKDVFDASVGSSFHGHIGSKVSALQQQVANYLNQIGQLNKSLFPMVREIRLMDERLEFYRNSLDKPEGDEGGRQNEVALKSTWVEVVEQGMQNPNSVYSMATKLGFVTLPDLFFGINPHGKTPEDQIKNLTKILGSMQKEHQFNQKVRDALNKKLTQYYTWKQKTYDEMRHTWKFRIKNLKQHYNVIRLYTSWLKPYLTTLKSLQMKGDVKDPYLISAFETSKLELELLCVMGEEEINGEKYKACVMVRFTSTTRPDLMYGPNQQKQLQHAGIITISVEPYVATQVDIDYYQKYTESEILKMYSGTEIDLSSDVEAILESLGEDVEEYLREAETGSRKEKKVEESEKKKKIDLFEPFRGVLDSVEMFLPEFEKKKKINSSDKTKIQDLAIKSAQRSWLAYEVFKKVHGFLAPL